MNNFNILNLFWGLLLSLSTFSCLPVEADPESAVYVPDLLEIEALQDSLFRDAIKGIEPVIDGPALFYLGLATDASSPVFEREIQEAPLLLDKRFRLKSRYLLLINSYKKEALHRWPLASMESLEKALRGMASVMKADDVLLLHLAGHGIEGLGVSFDFANQDLPPLIPRKLYELLREAGIQRSILVVSSCYSGVFANTDSSDDHIVITASAADKQSFGCNHKREGTLFGEVFFSHALLHASSTSDLIGRTKKMITQKEEALAYASSEPHFNVSSAGQQRLDVLLSVYPPLP